MQGLRLPIPRKESGETEQEASDGSPDGQPDNASGSGAPLKVRVKNTFIEYAGVEEDSVAHRAAQSCTARLTGQYPTGFPQEASPAAQPDYAVGFEGTPAMYAPPSALPPPLSPAFLPSIPVNLKQTVKNTFIEISESDSSSRNDRGVQSCTARMSDSSPSFQNDPQKDDEFTPVVSPNSPMTVPLLNTSPGGGPAMPPPLYEAPTAHLAATTTPSPPCGPPMYVAEAPTHCSCGNKFLDDAAFCRKCGAPRAEASSNWLGDYQGAGLGLTSQVQATLPSAGSSLHGTFMPDGEPACRPCAWFYKDGSCTNSQECSYCHLCPQGELKNRKKVKVAKLRQAEADEADQRGAYSPSMMPTGVSPKSAASKKVFLLSEVL